MYKYKSTTVSIIATFVFAAVMVAACIFLPAIIDYYLRGTQDTNGIRIALYICMYGSAVSAGVISYLLLRILFNVRKSVVFVGENVRYAGLISLCCFAVCVFFFALGFFIPFSFFVSFAAGFIGLIVRLVRNLLKEATKIKEENDLTI